MKRKMENPTWADLKAALDKLTEEQLRSSDHNPYTGKLSKKENILAAIELAKLCKNFADTGQTDEAMNIESNQWVEVIGRLEGKLLNCA